MTWLDDKAHTVAAMAGTATDDATLRKEWAELTNAPAFPSAEEHSLMDVVGTTDCKRVPVGSLDEFHDVVAGLDCAAHNKSVERVTYYRFGNLEGLRRSYSDHVNQAKVPPKADCETKSAQFLGTQGWSTDTVDIGDVLCHPDGAGRFAIEWTAEPLLFLGRAVNGDAPGLYRWFQDDSPPTSTRAVDAVNAQAKPPFPTAAEGKLLEHIPPASRLYCVRPDKEQIKQNVPDAEVTAVSCGPLDNASFVIYYQFNDVAAMNKNYARIADRRVKGACGNTASTFSGNAPYTIDGKDAGLLWCGKTSHSDSPILMWTHTQLKIQVLAFGVDDPREAMDWWKNKLGPQ